MTEVEGGGVPAGTQLNGIYEIERRVAMGGMGEVYIGRAIQTRDRVAIKMILPEHAHNQTILDLFRREASTLHGLYHEAIVRYYVFSIDPVLDRPYLAMEYAAGPSLADRIRERPLAEAEMRVLVPRLASGLAAAHKLGVIHRDISPDNVILVDGEVANAKIIDFGIAKSSSADGTLIGGGFAGKLNYVSPEQLGLEGAEVTGQSDIYSLGLVLAEAAIGRPLPMSGTQVEVIEKRRQVPDLAGVPPYLRPLIQHMTQPRPADRPADMAAVATWGAEGSRTGTVPPTAPKRGAKPKAAPGAPGTPAPKGGFPWLWAGLGVAAAAAVGAVVVVTGLGPEPPVPLPAPVVLDPATGGKGGISLSAVDAKGTLRAPVAALTAATAQQGDSYKWLSPQFTYGGDRARLAIVADGALPPGLDLSDEPDGTGLIYGIPTEIGEYKLAVIATSPEGDAARIDVTLFVKPAEEAPAPVPVAVAPVAPVAQAVTPPLLTPAPTPATPPLLTPAPGADLPTVAVPPSPGALAQPVAEAPALTPAPSGGGSGLAAPGAGLDPLPIPSTGAALSSAPRVEEPGPLAALDPAPAPTAPRLIDRLTAPASAEAGREISLRLGAFDDPTGALTLRVDGRLPNGVMFGAPGGVAQLSGQPTEAGDFSFEVVALDPAGRATAFPVRLLVTPPTANLATREFILGYDGGACFLSRPMALGPRTAQIEVFANAVDPVLKFDSDFKASQGFEAAIGLRQIAPEQCALITALDQVGPRALDNRLQIRIVRDELKSGAALEGVVEGGAAARLFLFDNAGGTTDLADFVTPGAAGARFSLPLHANGPQVLIAALADPASGLGPTAGLEDLLGAAARGQAALALGFIQVTP